MDLHFSENNLSYNVNNACQIYIIKQFYSGPDGEETEDSVFQKVYADLLQSGNTLSSKISYGLSRANSTNNQNIKLTQLIRFDHQDDETLLGYTPILINKDENAAPDTPTYINKDIKKLWFLTDLLQLRNCPLIDFTKTAYVFQITSRQSIWKGSANQSGLADVTSFNTNFSVNGQSSCEIQINNQDYKYNFKYFDDPDKYNLHLKPYFDTNDIIIVRMQKKNLTPTINKFGVPSSFKQTSINDYQDLYTTDKDDPSTTIFTGYINNVNESFSYETGVQTMSLACTGPSKKLAWTRTVVKQAAWSKDSASTIVPISAFINPRAADNENKVELKNKNIIANLIVRTYSGLTVNKKMAELANEYRELFDYNIHNTNNTTKKQLEKKLEAAKTDKEKANIRTKIKQLETSIREKMAETAKEYNDNIQKFFNKFMIEDKETGIIKILKNSFIVGEWKPQPVFIINGTNQPAYQYAFNDFSMFQSDWNTVYQFIKSIADNLLFNFYDDPYGVIHFSVPDITLHHLYRNVNDTQNQISIDPNVLDQINSFSQTQDTESIANVQPMEAKPIYGLDMSMINACAKDYKSIAKFGEKMMQPLSVVGITSMTALRYISKMRMTKYNRKALANIRIQCQGIPDLKMDKYAYIKPLRKLFYIESYSHSYQAGGNFTTSINGTYLRDILAKASVVNSVVRTTSLFNSNKDIVIKDNYVTPVTDNVIKNSENAINKEKNQQNILDKQLRTYNTYKEIIEALSTIKFNDSVRSYIYQCYVNQFAYPTDCVDLQKEIEYLYSDKVIADCYLDGYFWALPFDADPYKLALEIQQDEFNKNKTKANDRKIKTNAQNNNQQQSSKQAVEQVKQNSDKNKSNIIGSYDEETIRHIVSEPFGVKSMAKTAHNMFNFWGRIAGRVVGTIIKKPYRQDYTMKISLDTSFIGNPLKRMEEEQKLGIKSGVPVLKRGKE